MMSALLVASALAASPQAHQPLAACIGRLAEKFDFSGVVSVAGPWGPAVFARGKLGGPDTAAIGAESRFNLGSAGKMFTAVAIAQLVEAGKAGLDDPIGRHVAGLTPQAAAVTVRQLLTHTSGLGNFFTPENLPAIEKARTVSDLLPLVAGQHPSFPPGSRFQYSNSGYLLLGRLVERVSGQSYGEYLAKHVFGPVGMVATGLDPGPASSQAAGMTTMAPPPAGPGLSRAAAGEQRGPATGGMPRGPLRDAREAALHGNPAGGSYSTAPDMQRFLAALLSGRLVSAAMLEKLTAPAPGAPPAKGGAPQPGHGFGIGAYEGHRWFGHNGGAPGVNVETAAFPDDKISVVVLSNRDPPAASSLFRDLRGALFDAGALAACAGQSLPAR